MNTSTGNTTDSTEQAVRSELLSPRFYRTDYTALDALDVSPVRDEWDAMMAEFADDRNRGHFRQRPGADPAGLDHDPELKQAFLDFLVSSITSEYSGCVLYRETEKRVDNPDIAALMAYMARDESRHAGFINKALKELGVAVDLGLLKRAKKYTYFRPKFIFYATYLSEKIGYARYITIYRHLEQHPEYRFHPIFNWFQDWCNDEFRHGEAFALLMRAHPELLRGTNKLWIRFFVLAVYATMYVRDHNRPALYRALGMDPDTFDYRVFDITSAITRQVFPLTLDTDLPAFRRGLERLREINERLEQAKAKGGPLAPLRRLRWSAAAALTFARLYLLPTRSNTLPASARMEPAW
jgi:magnesium-protoporphyrin IX monomethyl ester (oxidative) cyclase